MALNQDVAFKISADVTGHAAVDRLSESIKNLGRQGEMSSRQMAAAMRLVPAQLTDIATQLAGGQSPFLIMMQQGGQLRDMFGSVTGALTAVGRTIAGMVTPITAAAAAFAGLGFVLYKGSEQSAELNRQLLLTGGAAGYTAGQIEKMAVTLRDAQGISAGAARDLTTGLAASGQFVGKNLDTAAEAAAKLQKLTGQSSEDIVKDFAKMSGGVAAWAAEHNKQFNYLTAAQFQYIKNLEQMGNTEAAMRENLKLLDAALEGRKRNLGILEKAWQAMGQAASWAWDKMLGIGRDKTPEEEIENLQKLIKHHEERLKDPNVQRNIDAGTDYGKQFQKELNDARTRLAEMQRVTDNAQKEAADKAKKAAVERQKIEEEQSGRAAALRQANLTLETNQLQGASQARMQQLDAEAQQNENAYRGGLKAFGDYLNEKTRLEKAQLEEKYNLINQEIDVEKKRQVNTPADAVNVKARIQALQNEKAQLAAQMGQVDLKSQGEMMSFQRSSREELEKFTRAEETHIEQIKLESEAVGMSTLEYKKHLEALRIDKEAKDLAKGKSPEFQEAIRQEAERLKEATAAALEHANALKTTFSSGVQDAMKDYIENTANAANQAKTLFTNAFKGMEDALVNFVMTGKLDFKSLADSIIADLVRITIQQQIMLPLMQAMKGFSLASLWPFADGGVMSAKGSLPLNAYASGGVADRPQMAIFGEGRTPEAYVPLPDGRSIPVAMQGNQGGANVTVNVINNAGNAKATTNERQDAQGNRIIDVMIEQVKASIAGDITRGVGTIPSALERTYGANRAAGAY